MQYIGTTLSDGLSVTELYSVHRFSLAYLRTAAGEAHPFPELLYLSEGSYQVCVDRIGHDLSAGQMILYSPNAYHEMGTASSEDGTACILSFDLRSDILPLIYNRVITLNEEQRRLIESIVEEASGCFHRRAADSSVRGMLLNEHIAEHTLWRLKKQIEYFLIEVYRSHAARDGRASSLAQKRDEELIRVTRYLEAHLAERLTLEQIAEHNSMSISKLKLLFRERTGDGPIHYLIGLRINEAKRLIREGDMNFTEIAEELDFSSVHYFSRQFKRITGMTPSEYAKAHHDVKVPSADDSGLF